MLLSDVNIREQIKSGGLDFAPALHDEQISLISIDMGIQRLRTISGELVQKRLVDGRHMYYLEPHEFYLADTENAVIIRNLELAGRVTTRSKWARQGIMVNMTSDRIAPGFMGQVVLEIYNASKVACLITANSRICQIEFEQVLTPPSSPYGPVKTF